MSLREPGNEGNNFESGARGMPLTVAVGPRRAAAWIRRGPVLWLTLCGCFLVAAIIIGTALMVGEFRERALGNSERELKNAVLLLARHFDQQFEDADIIANNLISQMHISEIDSPEAFKSQMSAPDAHLMLKSKVSVLSYIGDILIFDADGNLVNSSGSWPLPSFNVAERGYFKAFKSSPQSVPILAEPVRSKITGGWTTVIAHRLTGSNGVFLGAMARRIDPVNFEKFFASVVLGEDSAIAMFHRDGTMLARFPHIDDMIGRNFKHAPLVSRTLAQGGIQTLLVPQSPVDQLDRLGAAACGRIAFQS